MSVPVHRLTIATILSAVLVGIQGFADEASVESDVSTAAKPWTSLELNNDSSLFRFAVVSDNAGGPRQGIFREAMAKLDLLQPEFVITTGDLIEGYENTPEQLKIQWDRLMGELGQLKMRFYFVPGNHDGGRPLWLETYKARFGTPYYHFVYKNVLFLCLFTNDGANQGTGISEQQVEYAAKVLREHPDVRWTLVFQHKPLWNERGSQGWPKIQELLKGRKCTVFAGHTHNYLSQEIDGISYITLATTGGGSALRGPAYGEFDQIAWVTMTKDGPKVANLPLEGILDKDIRTPATLGKLKLGRGNRTMTASPIVLAGGPFKSGVSRLKIVNPAEAPLRVKVLSETPAGVRVEPGTVSGIVAGRGERIVELRVTADQPIPVPEAQTIVLHWTGYYDSDANAGSVELAGECRIPIEAPMVLGVRETPPVIDGKLDDWKELPFVVNQPGQIWTNAPAWKGPEDGSYRFAVSRDEENLYIAVKATDDEPCFDGWKYWQDFALVSLDARASGKDDPKASVFKTCMGPKLSREQIEEYSEGTAPKGLRWASLATKDGFEAEMAIPLSYVNQCQGGDWKRLRLNVAVSDFDRRDSRDGVSILYWRPEWMGAGGNPMSGVFVKTPAELPGTGSK